MSQDMSHIYAWEQTMYEEQMWNWLHFALDNRTNLKYKTPQTQRMGEISNTRPHFMSKGVLRKNKENNHKKHGSSHPKRNGRSTWAFVKPSGQQQINTWELFKDWKALYKEHYRQQRPNMLTHKVYVHYQDAVTEMHAFFDFVDDNPRVG